MRRALLLLSVGWALLLGPSCGESFSSDGCQEGRETCACYGNDTCDPGLSCRSGICVDLGAVDPGAPGCPEGALDCDGICVGVGSDNLNCGECSVDCFGGSRCVDGECTCESGRSLCETGCVDTSTDNANCGECGNRCGTGEYCQAGECVCQVGLEPCAGGCVATGSDPDHCGACDNACSPEQVCSAASCEASCEASLTECDRACVNVEVDVAHCGACNTPCPGGQTCAGGECVCGDGLEACGPVCADLQTHPTHCGACGNACGPGQNCVAGSCACGDGQDVCEGLCVSKADSTQHCGECNHACGSGEVCAGGTCACRPGTEPCGAGCAAPGTCGGGGTSGSGGSGGTGGSGGGTGGSGGAPAEPRCAGVQATCGSNNATDCCSSTVIPSGTFNRANDAQLPATISDFRLDDFEVTVGRFRPFVIAYVAGWRPPAGSGKNPNSSSDLGWRDTTYLPPFPTYTGSSSATWTDAPGANENRPINNVRWGVSFAFCVWDGGRLPTEAEWNYAAAGGGDSMGQRIFPWSVPPSGDTIDSSHAVFGCVSDCMPAPVGSKPAGAARWGQFDMAGNVAEWIRDAPYNNGASFSYPMPCVDCIHDQTGTRVLRGGNYETTTFGLYTYARLQSPEGTHYSSKLGFRCARAP